MSWDPSPMIFKTLQKARSQMHLKKCPREGSSPKGSKFKERPGGRGRRLGRECKSGSPQTARQTVATTRPRLHRGKRGGAEQGSIFRSPPTPPARWTGSRDLFLGPPNCPRQPKTTCPLGRAAWESLVGGRPPHPGDGGGGESTPHPCQRCRRIFLTQKNRRPRKCRKCNTKDQLSVMELLQCMTFPNTRSKGRSHQGSAALRPQEMPPLLEEIGGQTPGTTQPDRWRTVFVNKSLGGGGVAAQWKEWVTCAGEEQCKGNRRKHLQKGPCTGMVLDGNLECNLLSVGVCR